ncbi:hypothetical protein HDU84_007442 [Entophlyctis sp. JEL0112]|nr:hypothetical protein HDU84_007442 [Entophlyctis sp. JEL0112]
MPFAADTWGGLGFDNSSLNWFGSECGRTGSILELTLEPATPLANLTQQMFDAVAQEIYSVNTVYGVPVFLRYGHEMNGDWMIYGLQPTEYIASFRKMAAAVRAKTNMTGTSLSMVWAPNIGITYPFTGGEYAMPAAGTADFELLDTNKDGVVDNNDDPYSPYYPGDDVVDWVGLSLYNYPDPGCYDCAVVPTYFSDCLTGKGPGVEAVAVVTPAYTAVHDFYAMFCNDTVHAKPMMLPETGSPFIPAYANRTGAQTEAVIKSGWWTQLLSADTLSTFPRFRLALNFEEAKVQSPLGDDVLEDWKVANTTEQIDMFTGLLKQAGDLVAWSGNLTYACDGSVKLA